MLSGIKYVVSFGAFYFGDLIRQAKQNLVNNGYWVQDVTGLSYYFKTKTILINFSRILVCLAFSRWFSCCHARKIFSGNILPKY
jgi:hypothetical protein